MSDKCNCPNPGWCERHQMTKSDKDWKLCQLDTALGERYRKIWDSSKGNIQFKGKCGGCGNNMDAFTKPPKTIGKPKVEKPKIERLKPKPKLPIEHKPIDKPIEHKSIEQNPRTKLFLTNNLCPGDVLVMTGAIECLHEQHPGKYEVFVKTTCDAIFENSPKAKTSIVSDSLDKTIKMEYPLINKCNSYPVHFLQGYVEYLGDQLGIKLKCTVNRPFLYFSEEEKKQKSQIHELTGKAIKYWVINSGTKKDYTAKAWGQENYQELVDMLHGKIQFVQVGESHHLHKPLKHVINLIGKTSARQLIKLCWHAQGAVGPITFMGHIMGALQKPYVALLGGREPVMWEHYSTQTTMSTVGTLPCCKDKGCWKSRVVPLNDGDEKDKSLCELPVFSGDESIGKCMALISPQEVMKAVNRYYEGGILTY